MPDYQTSLACLETLVGLAQSDCACNTTGRPVTYANSKSGLFMDDYEHGLPDFFSKSAKGCGDGSMWDVLEKARYQGINDFITYLFKAIGDNLNTYVDGFSGEFGEVNTRAGNVSDKSCNKAITGFYFTPSIYNGASVKQKKIWLAVDLAGTYTVKFHDASNLTTELFSVAIVHPGGNVLTGIDIPTDHKIKPLSEAGKPITYVVSYERNGALPLNYTYYCGGCGDSNKQLWIRNKYMASNGFCVDALTDIQIGATCCNRAYTGGLILQWELICDPAQWICGQDESFWKSAPWGRIAAKAAQITITQKLIQAVLGKINFYTMFSAEQLEQQKAHLSTLTDELVSYLSKNMPAHANHCWTCKSSHGFSKSLIKV